MYKVRHVHKNDFNKQHHMLGYAACTQSTKSNGLKLYRGHALLTSVQRASGESPRMESSCNIACTQAIQADK